jgi:hypothetical protein
LVVPFAVGAYWTITFSLELDGIVVAPPLLRIENGGSCFGAPTSTCKTPDPLLLMVMLAVAVEFGAALKCNVRGDTPIRPVGVGVAVGVAVAVAVRVAVAVAVRVAVAVAVRVDVAVALAVEDAVAVRVAVAVAVAVRVGVALAVAVRVAVEVTVAVGVAVAVAV